MKQNVTKINTRRKRPTSTMNIDNESLDATSQAIKKEKSYAEAVNSQNEKIKRDRDMAYEFNESKGLIKLKQSSFN